MRIGSVFAATGALELGLLRAGLGPVVWQIEIDAWLRAMLARRFPDVVQLCDVRTVRRRHLANVDLICGGFPCQDLSAAGAQAGLAGARSGLWTQFRKIVEEHEPAFVVVENVSSGAKNWVDAIRHDLEQLSYATFPLQIAARDVGAPQIRSRVFVIGRRADLADSDALGLSRWKASHSKRSPLGKSPRRNTVGRGRLGVVRDLSDADRKRLRVKSERMQFRSSERRDEKPLDTGPRVGRCVEPAVGRVPDGVSPWLGWPAARGEPQHGHEPPRIIGRGDARERNRQLGGLGNGVVPECAEVAGWFVVELVTAGWVCSECGRPAPETRTSATSTRKRKRRTCRPACQRKRKNRLQRERRKRP